MNSSYLKKPRNLGGCGVFIITFLWVLIVGFSLQLLILPSFPSLHAGNGLLVGGDWVDFHFKAKTLVELMNVNGWESWELRFNENSPIGITAAIYYLVGIEEPWVLLPINALFFALAATLLYKIFEQITSDELAFFAVLPFIFFPSAAMIYAQIHKDVFSIAGVLFIIFVFVQFSLANELRFKELFLNIALIFTGCLLVWTVRPYLLQSIILSSILSIVLLILSSASSRNKTWFFGILFTILIELFVYKLPAPALIHESTFQTHIDANSKMTESASIPNSTFQIEVQEKIQETVSNLNVARIRFAEGYPNAGSNIDINVRFLSLNDVVTYIPRALVIGMLSPFPSTWFAPSVSRGGGFMRLVSAVEMIFSFIMLIGITFLIYYKKQRRLTLMLVTLFSFAMLIVLTFVVCNVGTLYRMRYGYSQTFNGFGLLGWLLLFKKYRFIK